MKVVALCLLHTKLIWHQIYSQLWHRIVWQICTHFRIRAASIIRVPRQVPLRRCYISTGLQWLDKQHHYSHLENLRSHFMTLNKALQSRPKSDWYLIVVCVSSLIVRVSVNKSEGVSVCLWLRSELLPSVICLACWDVTPCSLIYVCQECNWAQRNQT